MFRNSLLLDEDQYFELKGYVQSPGYVSPVLKGYLVSKRNGETWIASLIPQLFYGADGTQLTTWRQYISAAGEQVLLRREAGEPKVPREELYWRRVPSKEEVARAAEEVVGQAVTEALAVPDLRPLLIVGAVFLLLLFGRR